MMLSKAHLTSHSRILALDEWSHHRDYLGREGLTHNSVHYTHFPSTWKTLSQACPAKAGALSSSSSHFEIMVSLREKEASVFLISPSCKTHVAKVLFQASPKRLGLYSPTQLQHTVQETYLQWYNLRILGPDHLCLHSLMGWKFHTETQGEKKQNQQNCRGK